MSKPTPSEKLFLIDASSLIFRAFFAIRGLSNSKGLPTNAVYGFVTMLMNVLEKQKPDYTICVFDTPKPSFRKDVYKEYKANRGAPPDDLVPQFDYIHKAVESLGILKMAEEGFEADDVIATLTKKFKNVEIVIVTGDKDLMQLVDERVKVLDTMKNVLYGPDEVKEKLGVEPGLVTDYLGLIGDSSDNIPGVPSIGPKTAVDLLKEFGSMEKVLEAAPSMKPGKRRDVLIEHAKDARLSKQLATVHAEVGGCCAEVLLKEAATPQTVTSKFIDFLAEMEFKSLQAKYKDQVSDESGGATAAASVEVGAERPEVVTVKTAGEWKKCLSELSKEPVIAFDTETRGERTTEVEMVGFSLCGDGKRSFYVPVRHQGVEPAAEVKQLGSDLLKLFDGKMIVAQNIKYDYKVLLAEGFHPEKTFERAPTFDTMLAHYLIEPEEKHGLDALATRFLGTTVGDFKETLGDLENFSWVPLEKAALYGAQDAWATRRLHDVFNGQLKEQGLEKLFCEIEMPLARVIAHMEWDGVAIDPSVLDRLSVDYAKELLTIEEQIYKSVGSTFNLNSPKQLSEVLFGKLGLPVIQKTKTGYSTDITVLEKLAPLHPVPAQIVRYRELTKLKGTYIDVIPTLMEKDGRVHAHFNQAVAATGRLSSSDPNLQNIPIKTESGRKIRKAFVAGKGCDLVGADYSQIELRLVAHLSQDEALVKAFQSKQDVHRMTAAEVFGVKPDAVTDKQRGAAKAINFGLIYGKTAFGLAQELKISRTEAQNYIDAYFKRYKGVKAYMDENMKAARRDKFAKTMFGRKRPIKDIDSKNVAVRNNAERMAINTPVQGTAADIMKLAMIEVHKQCDKLGAKLVLSVHDELVLDVAHGKSQEAFDCLKTSMESAVKLSVPLDVDGGIAKSWFDL